MRVLENVDGKRCAVIEHVRWLKMLTDGTCLLLLFFFLLLFFYLFVSGRRRVNNGEFGSDLERTDDGSNGMDRFDGAD